VGRGVSRNHFGGVLLGVSSKVQFLLGRESDKASFIDKIFALNFLLDYRQLIWKISLILVLETPTINNKSIANSPYQLN
jgi:hypothetical protein